MTDDRDQPALPGASASAAWARVAVLVALAMLALRGGVFSAAQIGWEEPEALHVLLAPILIALLLWARRSDLHAGAGKGSLVALALLVAILVADRGGALDRLPEYFGRAALIPALAFAIAGAGGWRITRLCMPALLIAWLAIPPGSRFLPFFIFTHDPAIALVQPALNVLTDAMSEMRGSDLFVQSLAGSSFQPLVVFNDRTSEAMLLLGYLSVAVFIASRRPVSGRVITTMAIAALPVAVLGHLVRSITWCAGIIRGVDQVGGVSARWISVVIAWTAVIAVLALLAGIARPNASVPSGLPIESGKRPAN